MFRKILTKSKHPKLNQIVSWNKSRILNLRLHWVNHIIKCKFRMILRECRFNKWKSKKSNNKRAYHMLYKTMQIKYFNNLNKELTKRWNSLMSTFRYFQTYHQNGLKLNVKLKNSLMLDMNNDSRNISDWNLL